MPLRHNLTAVSHWLCQQLDGAQKRHGNVTLQLSRGEFKVAPAHHTCQQHDYVDCNQWLVTTNEYSC